MRRWMIAVAGTACAALLLAYFVLYPQKPAVSAGENGTFANDCCGTVQLADGRMVLNESATVRYDVERDAEGPYILPRSYVGVRQYEGFDIDGTRKVEKLRFDRLPNPSRIILYEGRGAFAFTRQAPEARPGG